MHYFCELYLHCSPILFVNVWHLVVSAGSEYKYTVFQTLATALSDRTTFMKILQIYMHCRLSAQGWEIGKGFDVLNVMIVFIFKHHFVPNDFILFLHTQYHPNPHSRLWPCLWEPHLWKYVLHIYMYWGLSQQKILHTICIIHFRHIHCLKLILFDHLNGA